MRRDQGRDDGQAQTGAARGAGPRGVGPEEALEDARGVLGREARAAVAHRQVHLAGPDRHLDVHGSPGGRVAQRVGHQVAQHLAQPQLVAEHDRRVARRHRRG